MPLLGGGAVYAGVLAGLGAAHFTTEGGLALAQAKVFAFVLGGGLLLLIGLWDDRFPLSAWQKLPFQIIAAIIAISCGYQIDFFTNPLTLETNQLSPFIVWPLTLVWIVAVTNAMNLIDGLDGLSAGLGVIISATLAVLCLQAGQETGVLLSVILCGALLGYLPFNFPPARIFLGDAGALFIGFSLALLSIQGYRKSALLTFVVPLLVLAVPLLDTALSVQRRIRSGRGIFSADKMHMHHVLLQREGSHRKAVLWLYFQTACFSIIAVSFSQLQGISAYVFLAAVALLTFRLLRNLGLLATSPDESRPEPPASSDSPEESS
jgi:UDP-GlcNAc:undecaprenyl-phosphate GlcNAc-1-phosphate transferase